MTDMQRVQALLDDLGVAHVSEGDQPGDRQSLVIESGAGPRNVGPPHFYTALTFDEGGTFLAVGAYSA